MAKRGFKIENFHFVGHSLGAHLLGEVGRTTKLSNLELNRITGLDPAGPTFFPLNPFISPLNAFDAKFVDIIHTDSLVMGATVATGHVDFWPNGGFQPNCPPFDSANPLNLGSENILF